MSKQGQMDQSDGSTQIVPCPFQAISFEIAKLNKGNTSKVFYPTLDLSIILSFYDFLLKRLLPSVLLQSLKM